MAPELLHSMEVAELGDIAGRVKAYQDAERLSDSALVRLFPDLGSTKTYNAILNGDLAELSLENQLTNYQLVIAQIEAGAEKRGARDEERYADFLGGGPVQEGADGYDEPAFHRPADHRRRRYGLGQEQHLHAAAQPLEGAHAQDRSVGSVGR